MDYGIFNVRTNLNACNCTRGCTDTVEKSALKVDSGRKVPCCTGESNLCWQRAGPMLYQLSYIPPMTYSLPSSHLSLICEGRWGITDDFATSFLHFSLLSTALWDLANSKPVHSVMLSSHLFLCLPCLLPPFTVPCKMVLARPNERET